MENVLGKMYYIFKGSEEFPYYTVTLVSRNITITNNMIVPFESTGMGRNMLVVEVRVLKLERGFRGHKWDKEGKGSFGILILF